MKLKLLVVAALFVLAAPLSASAAVDRAVVEGIANGDGTPGSVGVIAHFFDGTTEINPYYIPFIVATTTTEQGYLDAAEAAIMTFASAQGWGGINAANTIWPFLDSNQIDAKILAAKTATSSPLALSLQTSTGAVGTQVSTTSGAWVSIAGQVSTTATIGGTGSGDIILEVAPTNSATAGDWVEWARISNSQTITLAIALNSVQITKGQVMAWVPQGWYVKARSVGTGTFTNTLNTVKKVTQ